MPATSSSESERISVLCQCGKKLKAPASAVGRKAKCPNCGNILTIALPQQPKPIAPKPEPDADDNLDAMYALAQQEASSATAAHAEQAHQCPSCGSTMGASAVLCVSCGYDLRTR